MKSPTIAAIVGIMTVLAALAALAACGNVRSSTGPLTFGDEQTESCISNPPGRQVFVGQVVMNASRAPVSIASVSLDAASGVEPSDQYIVPIVNYTSFYTLRLPSKDPMWRNRIPVNSSRVTDDEEISVGVVVERTAKSDPGKIERIVVEYSSEGKEYVAKGTMKYLIPDKC